MNWERIIELYHQTLDVQPPQRERFLAEICGEDSALYEEVRQLLDHSTAADLYFEDMASEIAEALEQSHEKNQSLVGSSLQGYQLLQEIGRGGMAIVYLAEKQYSDFSQRFALKIIKKGLDTEEIIRRFRHERRILARLRHPNITQIIDAGITEEGLPFFVMEYVEGEQLLSYIRRQQLSLAERLALFKQVVQAISFAHQLLIIHRDIKPSNILVDANGQVKLLDFGIAKVLEEDFAEATQVGLQMMTPDFASPEQIGGALVSLSSDMYQLGLLLCQMLTNSMPYELGKMELHEKRQVIVQKEAQKPSFLAQKSGLPFAQKLRGDLDTIVLCCLQKSPENRYQSASALLADLERWEQGRPIQARPPSIAYYAGRYVQRHRWQVLLSTAFLVSIIGLSIFYTQRLIVAQNLKLQEAQRAAQALALAQEKENQSSDLVGFISKALERNEDNSTEAFERSRPLLKTVELLIDRLDSSSKSKIDFLELVGLNYLNAPGQEQEAVRIFKKILKNTKNTYWTAKAQNHIAKSYLRTKDYERALRWAAGSQKTMQESRHPSRVLLLTEAARIQAQTYQAQGQESKAVQALEKLKQKLAPEAEQYPLQWIELCIDLGKSYQAQKQYQAARQYYREGLQTSETALARGSPEYTLLNIYLAEIALLQGKTAEVQGYLQSLQTQQEALQDLQIRTVLEKISHLAETLKEEVKLP